MSARISVLVYNPSKISASQLPTSVLGLADPKYKGKIEIAPSETDFWPIVSSVEKTYGQAKALTWLKGLKANAGSNDNVPDNETLVNDVSQGTTDFALINHYYYYRLLAEVGQGTVNAKLAYFAPQDPGYLENISGAAILKSSKHQAAAQEFLAFMTSEAGQTVLAHGDSFEYPIHSGVAANPALPPSTSSTPTVSPPPISAPVSTPKPCSNKPDFYNPAGHKHRHDPALLKALAIRGHLADRAHRRSPHWAVEPVSVPEVEAWTCVLQNLLAPHRFRRPEDRLG